jgi:hypothetical protein
MFLPTNVQRWLHFENSLFSYCCRTTSVWSEACRSWWAMGFIVCTYPMDLHLLSSRCISQMIYSMAGRPFEKPCVVVIINGTILTFWLIRSNKEKSSLIKYYKPYYTCTNVTGQISSVTRRCGSYNTWPDDGFSWPQRVEFRVSFR